MNTRSLAYFLLLIACVLAGCVSYHAPEAHREAQPKIYPDYAGVTFPINIAPPNFVIRDTAEAYQTEIGYAENVTILIRSKDPTVHIPEKKWKSLLKEAQGKEIFFRISLLKEEKWIRYADIINTVSEHPIDPFLVYRLLYPGYELWNEMGIYQRDLTSYKETPLLENRDFGKQCVNCHSFTLNSPATMMLHIRGKQGGTLIRRNGQTEKVNLKPEGYKNGATYPVWHPQGRYIAFSMNEIQQFFHASGKKPIEVSDLDADLVLYDTQTRRMFTDSLVYTRDYMETFPAWSPDGTTLYFCRAAAYAQGMPLDSIRYDLYRIRFDEKEERLYDLECVYQASAFGRSVSFPRVSPDGRYLMFTQFDYGNFSIWHPESDLYLMDLQSGAIRVLDEVNSNDVDSYHTWASSGDWFVFSSKRMDGLWARPYLAAFDRRTGRAGKPFLLPQKDPEFYDTFTYTYNVPELIKAPVEKNKDFLEAIGRAALRTTR